MLTEILLKFESNVGRYKLPTISISRIRNLLENEHFLAHFGYWTARPILRSLN